MAMSYVNQLPSFTRQMIRMLPSYTTTDSISEKAFREIKVNQKITVNDVILKIEDNIKNIKGREKEALQEELELQLAIIYHGYEGIFPSDDVATKVLKSLKDYKPRFEI